MEDGAAIKEIPTLLSSNNFPIALSTKDPFLTSLAVSRVSILE